ncbi:hypothetical protein RND71_036447 [Anisodus tanguticus]|uniref:Uncharacterized protein n=1 Tax=Anisodus tanguticus TaxID=243964 RepID=A0AAE1R1U3_9SOLA|nr:hypothetical protein RND71_036447 [Anisodus tanguticus]
MTTKKFKKTNSRMSQPKDREDEFNNKVVTVKHPVDASPTLWIKGGLFDFILTYVNVPDMNGLELQQVINQVFALSVERFMI